MKMKEPKVSELPEWINILLKLEKEARKEIEIENNIRNK